MLALALSFMVLLTLASVGLVLGDFEQFSVYSQGQTEVQLAGVVDEVCRHLGSFTESVFTCKIV